MWMWMNLVVKQLSLFLFLINLAIILAINWSIFLSMKCKMISNSSGTTAKSDVLKFKKSKLPKTIQYKIKIKLQMPTY